VQCGVCLCGIVTARLRSAWIGSLTLGKTEFYCTLPRVIRTATARKTYFCCAQQKPEEMRVMEGLPEDWRDGCTASGVEVSHFGTS